MPAVWTDDDRRRVADGEISLADLATLRGVSRQAAHQAFRRRGWATGRERPEGSTRTMPPQLGDRAGDSSAGTLEAPAKDDMSIGLIWGSDEELVELVRFEAVNDALLILAKLREQLGSSRPLSPQGAKTAAAAVALSLDLLGRLGVRADADADLGPPRLIIAEMTAAEQEAIQARAEREHRGEDLDDDFDDACDAADDDAGPSEAPQSAAMPNDVPRPPPAAEAAQRVSEPPSVADLERLERRLRAIADRHGAAVLRGWCLVKGLETARAADQLIGILLRGVRENTPLASWLHAELTRLG